MKTKYPNGFKSEAKYVDTVMWNYSDEQEAFSPEAVRLPIFIVVSRLSYIIAGLKNRQDLTDCLMPAWKHFKSNFDADTSHLHSSFKQILGYVHKNVSLIESDLSLNHVELDVKSVVKEDYFDFISKMTISVVDAIITATMSSSQRIPNTLSRDSIFYQDIRTADSFSEKAPKLSSGNN
ncbi:MAG: hypothetical protein LRY67_06045 [Gammaproteobacteria bacterium]|nr:hypothetical protein [Gammaproteobacteria bacterium]MCD8541894.1 hypothetical protein [Gammaproteobacteria bacterium]